MNRKHKDSSSVIRDIKRRTRPKFSSEEKSRIVIEVLPGEESIAALYRKESITQSLYFSWSKIFCEAGKKRLSGDTLREANTSEVTELRAENTNLKEVVEELVLQTRLLKKAEWNRIKFKRYMRFTTDEKMEIIKLVEGSEFGGNQTHKHLGIHKSTFYN